MTDSRSRMSISARLAYLAVIALGVGSFVVVRAFGSHVAAPPPSPGSSAFLVNGGGHSSSTLMHLLLAMLVIIVSSRVMGELFKWIHQPRVIGEMLAGILLGPSLLGRVFPAAQAFLLPPSVVPYLNVLAQVGVILYMFLVGLHLDTGIMRGQRHATLTISHASIALPFFLGSVSALWLYPRLSTADVPFTGFSLFLGISLSVTAFPVLARILTDRGIAQSRLGTIALTCAAIGDVTAWCLLALVVGVVQAKLATAYQTWMLSAVYIGLMLVIARPFVAKHVRSQEAEPKLSRARLTLLLVALFASTLATEVIGIHAVFGSFLLGSMISPKSKLAHQLTERLEDVVLILFLPMFFASTGLRTEIGLVSGAANWTSCMVLVALASIGKFGGTYAAGRFTGMGPRDAASLGVLMNTRGLMELIVLTMGLDLGVISPTLFAMMVIMAVVTTLATTPILHLITRGDSASFAPIGDAARSHEAVATIGRVDGAA